MLLRINDFTFRNLSTADTLTFMVLIDHNVLDNNYSYITVGAKINEDIFTVIEFAINKQNDNYLEQKLLIFDIALGIRNHVSQTFFEMQTTGQNTFSCIQKAMNFIYNKVKKEDIQQLQMSYLENLKIYKTATFNEDISQLEKNPFEVEVVE